MKNTVYPAEKFADINDTIIQYLSYEGEGPAIVMLHATGFLPWLWHPVARELKDSYRIICPYFCNHRDQEPEDGGVNWMVLAEDLTKMCRTLQLDAPYIVGHSMGGAVAAIACGHFGLDVRKMVLIEPIILPREFYQINIGVEDHPLAGKSIKRRNFWDNAAEAKTYLKSKALFKAWDDEALDLYIQYGMKPSVSGGLELACHPRREAALFMGSMGFDPWPVLPKVTCPVLVLEGEHSENKGMIEFKKAAETFPNGQYRVFKDAGHLIPMEKPKEMVKVIRSFFENGECNTLR